MNRRTRRSRSVVLWGVGCYVVVQGLVAALLLWWMPTLPALPYAMKLRALQHRLEDGSATPMCVVALGSSRTAYGLRGKLVEDQLSRSCGRPVVVYNFGQVAGGPVTELLTLRRLLADGVRPDVVLIEVFPVLLNRRTPMTDLQEDTLPLVSLRPDEVDLVADYAASQRDIRWNEWLTSWLTPAHAHRRVLLSIALPTLLHFDHRQDGNRTDDSSGWSGISTSQVSSNRKLAALRAARKEYEERLHDFSLGGKPVRALRELLDLCRREKIRPVLVLMPEGPTFRSWYPESTTAAIDRFIHDLSRETSASVVDARMWMGEDAFLDSHHLLSDAAAEFTQRLCCGELLPILRRVDEQHDRHVGSHRGR